MFSQRFGDGAKRPSWRRAGIGLVLVVLLAMLSLDGLRVNPPTAAPAVEMRTIEGEKIALSELRGKVVLVSFWATDCTVCRREMPAMVDVYRSYHPRGFEAIFVAMPYDRPDRVLHYARSNALPFKVALDVQGEVLRAFGDIRGTPTTFVVDKRGRLVERIVGEVDFDGLRRLIERNLREPA